MSTFFFTSTSLMVRFWLFLFITSLLPAFSFGQEVVEIQNGWKQTLLTYDGNVLNLGEKGAAASWILERIDGASEVRIKHVPSGKYLHTETSDTYPVLGDIQPGWWSARWIIERVSGSKSIRFKNFWRGSYLHTEKGSVQTGAIQPEWTSAQWNLLPVQSIKSGEVTEETGGSQSFPEQISAANLNLVWKVNVAGYVEKSVDGGKKWTASEDKLAQISASRSGPDVAWGVDFTSTPQLTVDGGKTWMPREGNFAHISAVDANTAWATDADRRIMLTTDGGRSWTTVSGSAQTTSAVSSKVVWVLNEGNVWYSDNSGTSWRFTGSGFKAISSVSETTAWAINSTSSLVYTSDGGQTWKVVRPGYIHFCSAVSAWQVIAVNANLKVELISL